MGNFSNADGITVDAQGNVYVWGSTIHLP
ncbi:MAG: SBBP repeat-containing protein [Christensenellales bacterium]